MDISFEKMEIHHSKEVIDIYNYYVENSTAAFPTVPQTEERCKLFLDIGKNYPVYVIKEKNKDKVIGFCFLGPYSLHDSFNKTAAVTYFIDHNYIGIGVGSQCLKRLELDAKSMKIDKLVADISSENSRSIEFHKKNGFSIVGQLNDIGNKFGRSFGVIYMIKDI